MNSEINNILSNVSSELNLVEVSHYESHQHKNYLHEEGEYIKRGDVDDIIEKHLTELCTYKDTEIKYLKKRIDSVINEFKSLHEKAETLKDKIYLDGVLAVLETTLSYTKNESTES